MTPALTLPQVRYGLNLLLLEMFYTPGVDDSAVKSSVNYCAMSWPDSTITAPVSVYYRVSCAERYRRLSYAALRQHEEGEKRGNQ